MKNKKQSWEELAFFHLHGEQVRIYEQLVSIYSSTQRTNRIAVQQSYQLFVNALRRISVFFQENDIEFESGSSQMGTYLEFGYDIFARLNAELHQEMEVMYGANCVHFTQFSVKLYSEIAQALSDELLQKYQHTL